MIPEYSGKTWQQSMKGSGEAFTIPTDDIKIFPCFAEHPPGADKMQSKARYFAEKGDLQSHIILDGENNLIDGYTSYLLARQQGIRLVPARYGKRQIIRASHREGGKLYTWELPENLLTGYLPGMRCWHTPKRALRWLWWQQLRNTGRRSIQSGSGQ